jgi:eukaryotic-like serine/threonine-protein kinase
LSSDSPPTSGLVAEKYELVGLIGRGGMGSVWEARHATLGTRFAIKFIESEYADSQEARSRFLKEAKAAATVQSKHLIQIYDHGVTPDGKPYIVMELLHGEALDKRIERYGRLSLQDTARIVQQVSRGLVRAHERGIVHRDLKPENIFLVRTPDDDDEVAKVLDFGIAKVQTPHGAAVTSSTKTGAVLGTPYYMSPEQARGLRNVDHRTDVWSLGVIAFKCVTGTLPFDGESVGDLLVKICTAPIPVPSHLTPGIPPAFDAWFGRALEREPDRRFSTVAELADALAFAAGLSARVPSSSFGSPMGGQSTVASSNGAVSPSGRPPAGHYPGPTPQPAAMTAAPFTSSNPVPGTGGSRWKVVVGSLLAFVVVAGTAVGVTVGLKRRDAREQTLGVGLAPPAPIASESPSAAEPAPARLAAEPLAVGAKATEDDASDGAADDSATDEVKPTAAARKPAAKPAAVKPVVSRPATKPTADRPAEKPQQTSAPTSPAKKPNRHDPGY